MLMALTSCDVSSGKKNVNLFPVKSGKDYQYVDKEGKIIINPQFEYASLFNNGLALVRTSGDESKFGYIQEDGKYAITPSYKSATNFSDGLAWVVTENGYPTAINTKGEIKFTLQEAEEVRLFKEGFAAFSVSDSSETKWGFVDKEGKIKIPPQFTQVRDFSNGKCAVYSSSDVKWGFIDKEGKIAINYQFEFANNFKSGKAIVYSGGKAGLIDEKGKYIINPQFSTMNEDHGKYLIELNQKWGWCDENGKIVINPQFTQANPFLGNSLAPVQIGKSWGFIDKEGKITINPQFDNALPYLDGKLALVQTNNKYGFIDQEGKYVINPQYDDISLDLLMYSLNETEVYNYAFTDYFNITPIISSVNVNTPKGLLMSNKISDVISKLSLPENAFNLYSQEHLLIKNERISKDATLNFYVIANAYKEVPDGWYTRRILNLDAAIESYVYMISLTGKGYGKEKEVKSEIEKTFKGYVKDESQSTTEINIFKNKTQKIQSYINQSNIILIISNELNYNTLNNPGTVQVDTARY